MTAKPDMETELGPLPFDVCEEVTKACTTIGGWCPVEKGWLMAALVIREKPATVVEVGVYRGRSAISQALAIKKNGTGILYAIDAWEAAPTQAGVGVPAAEHWWRDNDFEADYNTFLDEVRKRGLDPWVEVLRDESQEAVKMFYPAPCVDILHVDGCHGEESALADVTAWLPKMKPGSFVWLDDVDWESVRPAYRYVESRAIPVGNWGRYALFRLPPVETTQT